MRHQWALAASALLLLSTYSGPARGEDLKTLLRDYESAKAKVAGAQKDRPAKVKELVAPVLLKIGKLDTKESLAFLLSEMGSASPEIGAACPPAVLLSSNDQCVRFLAQGLGGRHKLVAVGVLSSLKDAKQSLAAAEAELVRALEQAKDPDVKKEFPAVLAKVGTVGAARALLANVAAPKGQRSGQANSQGEFNDRVAAELGHAQGDEVRKWLSGPAFKAAGADPAKLLVVARAAGELKLVDARGQLEKLASHPDSVVATAAVNALSALGLGASASDLAAAIEKRRGKEDAAFRIQALDALAASGSDEALSTVLKFASGSDPDMRAVAMGSLALFSGKDEADAALARGLEDGDVNVRMAALRAMGKKRAKFMIAPLIAFLGREKEYRLKVDALQHLVRLTSQNMGLVHQDWEKWWQAQGPSFELPKGSEEGFTNVKVRDLSYFGIEVSSKRIGFLVDISSSMLEMVPVTQRPEAEGGEGATSGGTTVARKGSGGKDGGKDGAPEGKARKIDVLKKELASVIKKLPADTSINILTFHRTFALWQKELQPLAGQGRARAVQYVEELKTGVGTNVFDTLEAALKDKRVDTIYLLTDGMPTAGRLTAAAAILEEIEVQNRVRNVTIHCIAFGEESQLLKDLAARNGGQYRFVKEY